MLTCMGMMLLSTQTTQLSNPSGKHARWWSKVFGSGVKKLEIKYRAGKENRNADALSRAPCGERPVETIMTDVLVGAVQAIDVDSHQLLQLDPAVEENDSFSVEQRKDPEILEMIVYLSDGQLPACEKKAKKIVLQASLFALVDGVLYYLYKMLIRHWWWQNMYSDVISHCASCPQCAIVSSSGRVNKPLLFPIPVQRMFQIVGVDVMDLPKTEAGNRHVVKTSCLSGLLCPQLLIRRH